LQISKEVNIYNKYDIENKLLVFSAQLTATDKKLQTVYSEVASEKNQSGEQSLKSKVSSFQQTAEAINLFVSRIEGTTTDGIDYSLYSKDADGNLTLNGQSLISCINMTDSEIKISADKINLTAAGVVAMLNNGTATIEGSKINLEGVVTANDYFKINKDGSMEAISGKIGGWHIGAHRIIAYDGDTLRASTSQVYLADYDFSNNHYALRIMTRDSTSDSWAGKLTLYYSGKLQSGDLTYYDGTLTSGDFTLSSGAMQFGKLGEIDFGYDTYTGTNGLRIYGHDSIFLISDNLYVDGYLGATKIITINGTMYHFHNGILTEL
jgi:hypothetical protein